MLFNWPVVLSDCYLWCNIHCLLWVNASSFFKRNIDQVSSFWRNSRGISVPRRSYQKAHYTIRISDTFMILHLSDVLLQRTMDMLCFINCLFIITKVQCEEKKSLNNFSHNLTWVHTQGQNYKRRDSGTRIFLLCLFLLSPACLL